MGWLRYQSRTGFHNMYKEYRDTTMNGAVEAMYQEMGSRHRVRSAGIQIVKTAIVKPSLCKREHVTQFHDPKIQFPMVRKVMRPPSKSLRTIFKYKRPSVAMY